MSSTAINISYNRMQAQPDNPVSENIYTVNRTCNLLYAEMQRDEKGNSLDLWYVLVNVWLHYRQAGSNFTDPCVIFHPNIMIWIYVNGSYFV